MKKSPITYLRAFEDCIIDGYLVAKELKGIHYVAGYAHHWAGKYTEEFHTIEYRITEYQDCTGGKQGCKAKWVGFEIGGSVSPQAIYECNHGRHTFGLVSKNR